MKPNIYTILKLLGFVPLPNLRYYGVVGTLAKVFLSTSIMLKINYNLTSAMYIIFLLAITMAHSANANDDLWDALKEGGKVVIMRHAPVERGTGSGNPLVRDPSCKNESNLSKQGKRNAEVVGNRFRKHNIPVSNVMHSPFCRTTDTAKVAFGKASPAKYLSLVEILDLEEAALQAEAVNKVISSYTGKGNLILITHRPNINAISFESLQYLDFLVIEPIGEGEFEELGVIRFSE